MEEAPVVVVGLANSRRQQRARVCVCTHTTDDTQAPPPVRAHVDGLEEEEEEDPQRPVDRSLAACFLLQPLVVSPLIK